MEVMEHWVIRGRDITATKLQSQQTTTTAQWESARQHVVERCRIVWRMDPVQWGDSEDGGDDGAEVTAFVGRTNGKCTDMVSTPAPESMRCMRASRSLY